MLHGLIRQRHRTTEVARSPRYGEDPASAFASMQTERRKAHRSRTEFRGPEARPGAALLAVVNAHPFPPNFQGHQTPLDVHVEVPPRAH